AGGRGAQSAPDGGDADRARQRGEFGRLVGPAAGGGAARAPLFRSGGDDRDHEREPGRRRGDDAVEYDGAGGIGDQSDPNRGDADRDRQRGESGRLVGAAPGGGAGRGPADAGGGGDRRHEREPGRRHRDDAGQRHGARRIRD